MHEPLVFSVALDLLAVDQLPPGARSPSDPGFAEAVQAYFERQFAEAGGSVRTEVSSDQVVVHWTPVVGEHNLREWVGGLLQRGNLKAAVPVLTALAEANPEDASLLYDLGMAESDLGELDRAVLHLEKARRLDPKHANTLVALGVAQQRKGNREAARDWLDKALEVEPGNPYALKNKGAILLEAGAFAEAEAALREARGRLPNDPAVLLGLAQALDYGEDGAKAPEADELYSRILAMGPPARLAEVAEKGRSRLAHRGFRSAGGGGPRMDAVMYCLGALEKFESIDREALQRIAFEVAMLGRSGLDVNDPEEKYTLRSLPGSYSGLHLVCIMHVAFKIIAPGLDGGFDLAAEYEVAKSLHKKKS